MSRGWWWCWPPSFWLSVKSPSPRSPFLFRLVQSGLQLVRDQDLELLEGWPRLGSVIQALRNQSSQVSVRVIVPAGIHQIASIRGIFYVSVENLAAVYERFLPLVGPTQGDQGIHSLGTGLGLALINKCLQVKSTYPTHLPSVHAFSVVARRRCPIGGRCAGIPVPFFCKLFGRVEVELAGLAGKPYLLCVSSFAGVVGLS